MRTLKTMGIIGTAAALLFSATAAFAQESTVNTRTVQTAQERMQAAQERMQTARKEAQERMAEKRGKAEQRLADIQDKKKQQLAQRLAKQFDNRNATWTDHFMKLLDRYDAILQKIQNRADSAASGGRNITDVTSAIQSAQTAIASARTAVTAQAAKTYTLDASAVTTTTSTTTKSGQKELIQSLRASFKTLHDTLFSDLFALRNGVMTDARKAVQGALQALGKIPGADE